MQLHDMHPDLIELFVDGTEDALPDSGRLDGLGLGEGSVVFMLQRLGWCWTAGGSGITLSEDGRGRHDKHGAASRIYGLAG